MCYCMDWVLTQGTSLTWKKRNASFQPSFCGFASTFEKELDYWRVHGAGGVLEELSGNAVYALSLPFFLSLSIPSGNLFLSDFFRIQ